MFFFYSKSPFHRITNMSHADAIYDESSISGHDKTFFTESSAQPNAKFAKIIDLIQNRLNNGQHFFSVEILPTQSTSTLFDYSKFSRDAHQPLFTAITWSAANNYVTSSPAFKLAVAATPILSHITCHTLTLDKLNEILDDDHTNVISNCLALRGGR